MSDMSLPRTFRRLAPANRAGAAPAVPTSNESLSSGYAMASGALSGAVLVPRAEGVAVGFNDDAGHHFKAYDGQTVYDPQNPPHRHVLVQDSEGSGTPIIELDLAALDPELVKEALIEADRLMPTVRTVQEERDRRALAIHLLTQDPRVARPVEDLELAFRSVVQAPGLNEPVRDFSQPVDAPVCPPTQAAPVAAPPTYYPEAAPVSIKAASFGPPRAGVRAAVLGNSAPAPTPRPNDQPPAPVRASQGREPTRKVWLEYESHDITTYYHDVIESGARLVLCWDESWRYGRMFPRISEQEAANHFAVVVDDGPFVYLVETLDEPFTHNGWTYCLLSVVHKVPREALEN